MSPSLVVDDLLFVRSLERSRLRIGDIVVYRENGNNIVHRFLFTHRTTREIVTKADRSWYASKPFNEDNLIGVVEYIRREKEDIHFSFFATRVRGLFALAQYALSLVRKRYLAKLN
jgi:hypothetical protein